MNESINGEDPRGHAVLKVPGSGYDSEWIDGDEKEAKALGMLRST